MWKVWLPLLVAFAAALIFLSAASGERRPQTVFAGAGTSSSRLEGDASTFEEDPSNWEDLCVANSFPRPAPVVRSSSSLKQLEVTFLNMPERIALHKTPAKCTDQDDWQGDKIGRPIVAPTSLMLWRGVRVGHPHTGLLDPKKPMPEQTRFCVKAVPKILHFLWFCSAIPEHIVKRIVSFAEMNPTYKVMILVDVAPNQREVDLMNSPQVVNRPGGGIVVHYLHSYENDFRTMDILKWMDNISHNPVHKHKCAGMSDVARLETLYRYGGIYMDTDFVPDRPFADYGDTFRWPFVTHKVCGINIINSILSFDKKHWRPTRRTA